MRSRIFGFNRRQKRVAEIVRFKEVNTSTDTENVTKNVTATPTSKATIPTTTIHTWVVNVAGAIGEDDFRRTEAIAIAGDVTSWAELLAALEDENWHTLYAECQRRLQIPESDVHEALMDRKYNEKKKHDFAWLDEIAKPYLEFAANKYK